MIDMFVAPYPPPTNPNATITVDGTVSGMADAMNNLLAVNTSNGFGGIFIGSDTYSIDVVPNEAFTIMATEIETVDIVGQSLTRHLPLVSCRVPR